MSCYSISLSSGTTKNFACIEGFLNNFTTYYADDVYLSGSTKIYTDSGCTTYAPSGFYSDFWGGVGEWTITNQLIFTGVTACTYTSNLKNCCDDILDISTNIYEFTNISDKTGVSSLPVGYIFQLEANQEGLPTGTTQCYEVVSGASTSTLTGITWLNENYSSCTDCVIANSIGCYVESGVYLFLSCFDSETSKYFEVTTNFTFSIGESFVLYEGLCWYISEKAEGETPESSFTDPDGSFCEADPLCTTTTTVPSSLYLEGCCDSLIYISQPNTYRAIGAIVYDNVTDQCYTVIATPSPLPLFPPNLDVGSLLYLNPPNDGCATVDEFTCPECPPPTPTPIPPSINVCVPITLFEMVAVCGDYIQPTTSTSFDGSVSVIVSGGSSPYTINWSNGIVQNVTSASTITNLNIGTYIATIVDYWGDYSATTTCLLTGITTTTTSTTTTTTQTPYSEEFCMSFTQNGNTNTINFIYNGSVNGQPSWISNDPIGYTITGNTLGSEWRVDGFPNPSYGITYTQPPSSVWNTLGFGTPATLTTTDGSCTPPMLSPMIFSVPEPNYIVNLKLSKNEPLCGCDGAVTILASNGTPPYSYSVDGGVTYKNSPFFTNMCDGLYTISVIDNDGNSSNSSITLSKPPLPTQYSLSLNKSSRITYNDGVTTTKVTDVTFSISPELPNDAYITFDLIHNNTLKCSPTFSAASLVTNTTFTKNETPVTLTLSGTSSGETINTYPGCQDQTTYVSTYTENWVNIDINSTDNFVLSTTSSVSQVDNLTCYYVDNRDSYYLINLKINNCSCCSVRNI